MAGRKIKIGQATLARINKAVAMAGYASAEELVETAIERELQRVESTNGYATEADIHIRQRLKGLGYLE